MSSDVQKKQELFQACISKTFDQWQSFKIAIQQSTVPAAQFTTWLMGQVENYFYQNAELEYTEVADWLDDIMDADLDVRIQDGTVESVANKLSTYYSLIKQDKLEEANTILQASNVPIAPVTYNTRGSDDDSDDSDDSSD